MEKSTAPIKKNPDVTKAQAVTRYLRISPRKVRLVLDAVRRKPAGQAMDILMNLNKKAARMAEKTLKSAIANAKVLGLDEHRLIISDFRADGGPVFKRFMSRSMGRADRILKRTTHISVVVEEGQKSYGSSSVLSDAEMEAGSSKKKQKSKVKLAATAQAAKG